MEGKGRFARTLSVILTLGLVTRRLTSGHAPVTAPERQPEGSKALNPPGEAPNPPDGAPKGTRDAPRHSGIAARMQLISKAISRFMDDDGTTMAAALAYYTTFSIAPLLLIVISIVGLVFGRQAVQQDIQTQIQGLLGQDAAAQIGLMITKAGQQSSTGVVSAVLGGVALIVGATGAFGQLQSSLNRIWHVKPDPKAGGIRSFLGQRVLSLGMVLAIAFLLVVSLTVSAALSAFSDFITSFLPHGLSGPLLQGINFLVSLMIVGALFAAMFKVLPDARIEWRKVWIGAAITAVLFTIGKFLIGLYLGHSGTASAYGAAGSFVLIVLWTYYSSMIFLFGAELTAVWSEMHSRSIEPAPGAVKVKTEEKVEQPRAA